MAERVGGSSIFNADAFSLGVGQCRDAECADEHLLANAVEQSVAVACEMLETQGLELVESLFEHKILKCL